MERLVIALIIFASMIPIAYGINDPALYEGCFDGNVTLSTAKHCYTDLYYFYVVMYDSYDIIIAEHRTLNEKYDNDTKALKEEVQLWKNKYSYVIAQHGNYSIQDQITNLTDRVDSVETKAATNESHIYIIQNMLRTVQTDIEDIFLKINSVR